MGLLDKFFGPPKPDKFARMVMNGLNQAGDTRNANYDPEQFQLNFTHYDGKDAGIANLTNIYHEHCVTPKENREQHLRNAVLALFAKRFQIPDEFEDAKHDLRPVIRTRTYFEFVKLQAKLGGGDFPDHPLHEIGDHWVASLVYDLPESMQSLSQKNLDEWGVSYYEAMEVARHNLEETDYLLAEIGDGLYATSTGDNYDASRLLLLDLIHKMEVKGDHIAMIPNRDTLLVTGSEDEEGLAIMAELAEKAIDEDSRPMLAIPLRLDGDEWVSWMLNSTHPLFNKYRTLEVKSLYGEYADQKSLLDEINEKQEIDVFVASYTAAEKDDGPVVSYCVWSKGVESLLPQTNIVMFYDPDKDETVANGEWDKVQAIVGSLMTPVEDLYPLRFRVTGFPTEDQLEAIGGID